MGIKDSAKVPLELRPQTKVNAKTSAQLDTDEDNDSEDNDSAAITGGDCRKNLFVFKASLD